VTIAGWIAVAVAGRITIAGRVAVTVTDLVVGRGPGLGPGAVAGDRSVVGTADEQASGRAHAHAHEGPAIDDGLAGLGFGGGRGLVLFVDAVGHGAGAIMTGSFSRRLP